MKTSIFQIQLHKITLNEKVTTEKSYPDEQHDQLKHRKLFQPQQGE